MSEVVAIDAWFGSDAMIVIVVVLKVAGTIVILGGRREEREDGATAIFRRVRLRRPGVMKRTVAGIIVVHAGTL